MYSLRSSQLKCESPSIILNPHLEYFHRQGYRLSFLPKDDPANICPYGSFRKYCLRLKNKRDVNISIDDFISKYNLVQPFTGETFPLFVLVPCGHCLLCRSSKISRWQFRSACEMFKNETSAYFVTLTYDPKFLPLFGVSIRAMQLFIKRLRIRLTRLNIEHSLKYIACGEYGKDGNRPHYHLVLFNFPQSEEFPTLHSILSFIEDCWSTPDGERIGFCYVKPCDTGSVKYVLKYLLKETRSKLEKDYPPFYTFSKGIGEDYLKDNFQYYKNFLEDLSLSCLDVVSGKIVHGTFPTYYLKKFSGINNLFCPAVRESFKELFAAFIERWRLVEKFMKDKDFLNAYPAFPLNDKDYFLSLCEYYKVDEITLSQLECHFPEKLTDQEFHEWYYNLCEKITYFKYIFEENYINLNPSIKDALSRYNASLYKRSLHNFYMLPDLNVMSLSANKLHNLRKSIIKDLL